MTPAVAARFERICKLVGRQRRGITLRDLAGAHALARELEADDPRPARLEEFARELGISLADVETSCDPEPAVEPMDAQLDLLAATG